MKYLALVIIALVALVAADEEWKVASHEEEMAFIKECYDELTPEQKRASDSGKTVYEKDYCRFKKLGVFDDEKGFNLERVMMTLTLNNFDAEQSREDLRKCFEGNKKTSTVAEWAYRSFDCMRHIKFVKAKN